MFRKLSQMKRTRKIALITAACTTMVAAAIALPFLFLQPGFTQELYATSPGFMGGVAFAPNGDVWVTPCVFSGGNLRRFDANSTIVVNGTTVHPLIATVPSTSGCGLTNHPDGFLYSNTSGGVTRINATTGAPAGGPFGPGGNALGITSHPATGEIYYTGASNGPIFKVDNLFSASSIFSTATQGFFVDGIYFDPSGQFLFTSTRTGGFRVTVIRASDGALVQHVPLPSEPDGIAFHAAAPKFVVTNNLNGTLTRLDFPNDDFTQPPVVSLFASGGFRGDLTQVGADGNLYLTQDGTRFDNGAISSDNSIVRIGPGFVPPPGVGQITLAPLSATTALGNPHTVTASVELSGAPLANQLVTFNVISGPNLGGTGTDTTDVNGEATFTYNGTVAGTDTLQASFVDAQGVTQVSNTVTNQWTGFPTTTLTCPPDVVEVWTVGPAGGQTDPSLTGFATYFDACDPTPDLSYADTLTPGIHAGEPETVVTRTWTLTDDCGTVLTCTQTITLLSPAQHGMFLDAIPGQCPNELHIRTDLKLGVSIVGSIFQSADAIQPSSLRISRLDGVGYMMAGFEPALIDQVTPDYYAKHACHVSGADGSMDLEFWFHVPFVKKSLKLTNLPDGTLVPVRVSGRLLDGTPFEVRDSLIVRQN